LAGLAGKAKVLRLESRKFIFIQEAPNLTSAYPFIPLRERVRVKRFGISPPHPASPPERGDENDIFGWTLTKERE
jgi:hypothetical protein